ncbi:DNA-3-methyladenine glycosylase I [Dankookia sp. GCM10030260]|uniref:DNA-3-methyladenine glycosylase I n=1 Tax=Dankookia sp. GCM10030260 TaxID=3273390 RepID=UPI00360865CA
MSRTLPGPDGRPRCHWCMATPDYLAYHDTEWGFPVADDTRLFEKLCLEGFQSGLSWRTILAKRENFRAAFHGFAIDRVAAFDAADVQRLLGNAGIVRHRGKIEASIGNARRAQELVRQEGSLAAYIWRFEPAMPPPAGAATCEISIALSKDLKRRGWAFVGPTTVHAFLQAMGVLQDHAEDCAIRPAAAAARAAFRRPG